MKSMEGSKEHFLTGITSVFVVVGEDQGETENVVLMSTNDLLESRNITAFESSK
jgi:hypothetical protein